jgi:hypothetical protein
VGPTHLEVDGFFSLNAHAGDRRFLPHRYRLVVATSELLRRASSFLPFLTRLADSLYVVSMKERRSCGASSSHGC